MVNESSLDIAEVARSIELYLIGKEIHELGKKGVSKLVFTREPVFRQREEVSNLVVAAGSYDPLSIAHVSLFRDGLRAAKESLHSTGLDETLILTCTAHFNKEVNLRKNAAIYDRVHAQEGFARCEGNVSLAFFNRPLFADMVDPLKSAYSNAEISFIVGTDVMQKILDPTGYASIGLDSAKVQEELFTKSRFVVSQRKISTPTGDRLVTLNDLQSMYPECLQYSDRMIPLVLSEMHEGLEIPIEDVSSTLIRKKRNEDGNIKDLVAVGISEFVDKRSLYLQDSDKYAAFVCARQRFADAHVGKPIACYINELMNYLVKLDNSSSLREMEVREYGNGRK
ncbi:MAG: hypothetical protein WCI72_05840 [archaeon]